MSAESQASGETVSVARGARKVATQKVPVVFDPSTAASLLGHVCSAVSGSALYRGASFLLNCLDTRIAPETVTIYDDGTLPGALGSKPFDGEGIPTRRTTVVEQGLLRSYLLDTYTARKLGQRSTGNEGGSRSSTGQEDRRDRRNPGAGRG